MDLVIKEFCSKAIVRGNMYLFNPQDAINVIRRCKELKWKILGVDGFRITERTIQPFQEHSSDYSTKGIIEGNWEKAENFIFERKDLGFVFEIVYDSKNMY